MLQFFEWPLLTWGVLKKFLYREASSRGPTTYPFIFHFLLKRYPFRRPSIDKWYPFHMPSLELFIPLNCCKPTVFEICINHKTTTISRRFSLQPKMQLLALLGLFTDRMTDSLPFHILQLVKSLSYSSKPEIGIPFGWSLSV